MKNKIGLFVIGIVAAMAFVSCEPVENRQEMKGAVTMADIDKYVTVTQEVREGKKSNFFSFNCDGLQALSSFTHDLGVTIGTGTGGKYIQCFLFPGQAEVLFSALSPDGTKLSKTFNFTVEEAFDVAPQWDMLTASSSKTWVFAGTGGDDGIWYAMADPGAKLEGLKADPRDGIWWNAGGECCPPSDVDGRMVFEAIGLAVTTYASPSAAAQKGTFEFSSDFAEITFKGVNALGASGDQANKGVYKIINLSDDDLFLFVGGGMPNGTGWVWRFKPQP